MRVVLLALFSVLISFGAAEAKQRPHQSNHKHSSHSQSYSDGRPSAWCGWFMRTIFGGGSEYNVARNWSHRGSPTHAHVGAVVVWPHHVGVITGRTASGQWIVKSGNDGGRVRERPRSVSGAIAFRDVGGTRVASSYN